jgi:hypothetical protein
VGDSDNGMPRIGSMYLESMDLRQTIKPMVDPEGSFIFGLDLPRTHAASEENACGVRWNGAFHLQFGPRGILVSNIKLCCGVSMPDGTRVTIVLTP